MTNKLTKVQFRDECYRLLGTPIRVRQMRMTPIGEHERMIYVDVEFAWQGERATVGACERSTYVARDKALAQVREVAEGRFDPRDRIRLIREGRLPEDSPFGYLDDDGPWPPPGKDTWPQ